MRVQLCAKAGPSPLSRSGSAIQPCSVGLGHRAQLDSGPLWCGALALGGWSQTPLRDRRVLACGGMWLIFGLLQAVFACFVLQGLGAAWLGTMASQDMGGDDWLPTVETFELIGTAPADEPEEAREEMRDETDAPRPAAPVLHPRMGGADVLHGRAGMVERHW